MKRQTSDKRSIKYRKSGMRDGKGFYAGCILLLSMVIAGAFFLPRGVFYLQDRYQMGNTTVKEQAVADVTDLNLTYEKELGKRMSDFASDLYLGRRIFTAFEESALDEKEGTYLEEQLYRNDMLFSMLLSLYDVNMISYDIIDGDYLNDLLIKEGAKGKRYVIYDGDYANGIAFSCLYWEVQMPEGNRLQVLMDTEDHTLYYLSVSMGEPYQYDMDQVNETVAMMREKEIHSIYDLKTGSYLKEFNGFTEEDLYYNFLYVQRRYYEADLLNENPDMETEQDLGDGIELVEEAVGMDESLWYLSMPLPYGKNEIHAEVSVLLDDREADGTVYLFSFGIREIGELIPEFKVP